MAFNWLKKAITAPVKLAGKIAGKAAPIVKVARPILQPAYETVVPAPIRKAIRTVKSAVPVINIFKRRSDKNVSELEAKFRTCVQAAIEASGTSGVDLALRLGVLMQNIMALAVMIRAMPLQQLVDEGVLAIDSMTGSEPSAFIGPNGTLVKFDIPMVDDEVVYDLVTSGAKAVLTDLIDKADDQPN